MYNESSHLFDVVDSEAIEETELKKLINSQSYIPDKSAICCTCIPSRVKHYMRSNFGRIPRGRFTPANNTDEFSRLVYFDDNQRNWSVIKPCCSCCQSANSTLLVNYDDDIIAVGLGSTEVRVINMLHEDYVIERKTHNYRDPNKTSYIKHFFADIIPTILYCHMSYAYN